MGMGLAAGKESIYLTISRRWGTQERDGKVRLHFGMLESLNGMEKLDFTSVAGGASERRRIS